jgi:hypothetical protein
MPKFTIETTYHLPVFRQRTYDAATLAEACQAAIEDRDWSSRKDDYESSGATFVSGAWEGDGTAYRVPALCVPGQFLEPVQRRAGLFEVLLGMLEILAHADDPRASVRPAWLPRARAVVAQAEAVLEGASDPYPDPAEASGAAYRVLALEVARVHRQVAAILETEPDMSPLSADAVTDREIRDACDEVAAAMDLSEQIGAAAFRAGFLAIRAAHRRLTAGGGKRNA